MGDHVEQNYSDTSDTFSLQSIFLPVSNQQTLQSVIKSFPKLKELSLWTSLSHIAQISQSDLAHVDTLKIGGLNYSSLLTEMTSIIGHQLLNLKIETVHFDINIDIIAHYCPNIEELSLINARICVTHPNEKPPYSLNTKIFTKLKKLYLFLVSYLTTHDMPRGQAPANITDPARVRNPTTGLTALHSILSSGVMLENVTVTGTNVLTDQCLS